MERGESSFQKVQPDRSMKLRAENTLMHETENLQIKIFTVISKDGV